MSVSSAILHLFIGIIVVLLGIFFLLGAMKKWEFLVDPDEKLWFVYNISFAKKFFGFDKEDFIAYFYFVGICFLLFGVYFIYLALRVMYYFFRSYIEGMTL
jgi:hypothetical protein